MPQALPCLSRTRQTGALSFAKQRAGFEQSSTPPRETRVGDPGSAAATNYYVPFLLRGAKAPLFHLFFVLKHEEQVLTPMDSGQLFFAQSTRNATGLQSSDLVEERPIRAAKR